jgi:hypothetical protein
VSADERRTTNDERPTTDNRPLTEHSARSTAPAFWWRGIAPLEFLAVQRSLPGLVARRHLLKVAHPSDGELEAQLRRGILVTQLARGSWGASLGWTACRLGQLQQLGMTLADEAVRRGVEWIYERQMSDGSFAEREEIVNSYATVVGEEMPFGRRGIDITAFALAPLLALGAVEEAPVQAALAYVRRQYPGGKRCCARCTANLLRMLALSPERGGEAATSGLAWLASHQRNGGWRATGGTEFYFILDAVGSFDHPEAERQIEAALPALRRLLQKDGGWGISCRAEKTLAVCRALFGPAGSAANGSMPSRLAAFLSG